MLVEIAVGDAYGAGFEYVKDPSIIRDHNNLSGYIRHPIHNLRPGSYTDDTQMSIAVAELIINEKIWTPEIIAKYFLEAFHRDERDGYARRFQDFLSKTKTAKDFLDNIIPDSDKSGGAMRAGPIGIYPTIKKVISHASLQASLTHNTPDGKNAAVAAALMTHYFIYDLGKKEDLPKFLCDNVPGNWDEPWRGKVLAKGWMSVRAAITSLVNVVSLSDLLISCVNWEGDVDTVAAIALAAGSVCKEIKQDLPDILLYNLEAGKYGRLYLEQLDKTLMVLKK